MPRDAVSRTANVERTGRHKWVKEGAQLNCAQIKKYMSAHISGTHKRKQDSYTFIWNMLHIHMEHVTHGSTSETGFRL